jgi:hypothetical protein
MCYNDNNMPSVLWKWVSKDCESVKVLSESTRNSSKGESFETEAEL